MREGSYSSSHSYRHFRLRRVGCFMPQAALQPGKGPSCECSKRLGYPLCSSRCLGDKKSVLPLPRTEPKLFGILHTYYLSFNFTG